MNSNGQSCTSPGHHAGDPAEYLRKVERNCRERGLRLTPLRTDVLRLIANAERPVKAYDLLERIRASKARSAPATAYRSLNFLLEQGFIHKLASLNAFVRCHHPGQLQHIAPFLICNQCLQTIELEDDRTAPLLDDMAVTLGFRAVSQTLEVRGLCARCNRMNGAMTR